MAEVFISYARSTARQARGAAEALRTLGHSVWLDDDLPAHRAFSPEIEAQLTAAKAVLVIWSSDATRSDWVLSEANRAREERKLVQLTLDGARLPMPFDQIQCADLTGWTGDLNAAGWRRVAASIAELVGALAGSPPPSSAPAASPARPLPAKPSLAVMPFVNLSGDTDHDYFAEGMVEEIVSALARFRSIFVIASGATLAFKGQAVSPQDVAQRLGVRYLLDGSIRKGGRLLRIAVKLTDAASGAQIWSDRFEDTLDDILALQDRVAFAVAGVIEPTVREHEIRRAARKTNDELDAYDLYLRALPHYRSGSASGTRQALELLSRSIELEPDYGAALGLAASCQSRLAGLGWANDRDTHRQRAISLATQALRVAGDDPDVLVRVASVLAHETSDDLAAIFDRAIALNPTSATAHVIIAENLLSRGDAGRAKDHIETSMRLDPLSPMRAVQLGLLGAILLSERRYLDALVALTEANRVNDDVPHGHMSLAACYAHLGQRAPAIAELKKAKSLTALSMPDLMASLIRDERVRDEILSGVRLAEAMASEET
jgi:TolB-like protein